MCYSCYNHSYLFKEFPSINILNCCLKLHTQKYCTLAELSVILFTVNINYVLNQFYFIFFINVYSFNGLYRRHKNKNLITMIIINVIIVIVMTTITISLVLVMILNNIIIYGVVGYIYFFI